MKKLLLILLCLPMIGFGQQDTLNLKDIRLDAGKAFIKSSGELFSGFGYQTKRGIVNYEGNWLYGLRKGVHKEYMTNRLGRSIKWEGHYELTYKKEFDKGQYAGKEFNLWYLKKMILYNLVNIASHMGKERLEKITLYARINGRTVRHGLEQKWHTNSSSTSGPLHWEKNYKDGLQDGLHRMWHYNGELYEEGMYEQKQGSRFYAVQVADHVTGAEASNSFRIACKTGLWKKWHINGQLMEEGNYITTSSAIASISSRPAEDGFWKYWHKNGQLKEEGNYIEGKKDGLWKLWDETGKLRLQWVKNYKDGIVIE